MSTSSSTPRLEYVDIMKGIAITLVVIVHINNPVAPAGMMKFISGFTMQLFFMTAGMVSRRREVYPIESIKANIRKKFLSLMVPYFVWCLIFITPSVDNLCSVAYGSCEKLLAISPHIVHLWFLPSFFLASLMLNASLNLSTRIKSKYFLPVWTILMFAIGFSMPKIPSGYPWGINLSFVALGYMLCGYSSKDFVNRLDQKSPLIQIPFILIPAAVLTVGTVYGLRDISFVSMCTTEYGPIFWFLVNGLAGIIMVRAISSLLAKAGEGNYCNLLKRGAIWLGQNSMGVFIVQMPVCICVTIPLMQRLGLSQSNSFHILIAGLAALFVSSLLTVVIKALCPQILGKN